MKKSERWYPYKYTGDQLVFKPILNNNPGKIRKQLNSRRVRKYLKHLAYISLLEDPHVTRHTRQIEKLGRINL